jgi:hypothetical protein
VECRQFDKSVDAASSAVGIGGSISFRTEMIAEGLTGKEAKKNQRAPVLQYGGPPLLVKRRNREGRCLTADRNAESRL